MISINNFNIITISASPSTANALNETVTNVLCEDYKYYSIGKSLAGVSYALQCSNNEVLLIFQLSNPAYEVEQ